MKILGIVLSINQDSAGLRQRILPIFYSLKHREYNIEIKELKSISKKEHIDQIASEYQLVIFIKIFDDLAYCAARAIKDRGIKIVLDLFDNYLPYSRRAWEFGLKRMYIRMANIADIVTCSTNFLASALENEGIKNIKMIPDPIQPSLRTTTAKVDNKDSSNISWLEKWNTSDNTLRFAWFGLSGNPYYRAGIVDLAEIADTFLSCLTKLEKSKTIELVICCESNPSLSYVFERFRSTAIRIKWLAWSQEIEDSLLANSHCILLPTNRSGFASSKTHNRASKSLLSGCLVYCSEMPGYDDISEFCFNSISGLIDYITANTAQEVENYLTRAIDFVLNKYTLENSVNSFDAIFCELINEKNRSEFNKNNTIKNYNHIVLTGPTGGGLCHKFAQQMKWLSCSVESMRVPLNFDFQLREIREDGSLCLSIGERERKQVRTFLQEAREMLQSSTLIKSSEIFLGQLKIVSIAPDLETVDALPMKNSITPLEIQKLSYLKQLSIYDESYAEIYNAVLFELFAKMLRPLDNYNFVIEVGFPLESCNLPILSYA
ncbi:hypothetical protein DO97_15665 [Neosynechococcus sphagnicola sy1]|uniref:Glycosyltransferase subfamily 4-like N-terminal domain-containing protein n=1 Tax=Neosynechococcus sphagnicola sy1 TaxID=1497020 RepID=A0A098TLQ4_9CYAN|nr:hypothetical protein [Neosynechococcus sphagnicola]KGF71773.1 hypothetical protein DO97_15665 [Neosynechococcus sphagnicola sy1]